MSIWENTEFRIFAIQCTIAWITLLIAIIMCLRSKDKGEYSHRTIERGYSEYAAKSSGSPKAKAPMLTFVTVDEIYEMPLEALQSVPEEHMNQLPMDKRAIVKRRINELIQAERAKKNK